MDEKETKDVNDVKNKSLVDEDVELDAENRIKDSVKRKFFSIHSSFWLRMLIALSIILCITLTSIVTAFFVFEYQNKSFSVPYQPQIAQKFLVQYDVYVVPEFRLTLDKSTEDDNMSTILQIKLALAYEKGNQRVLDELIHRKEQIRDKIQYVVASKRYEEINTSESRESILKQDLIYGLNAILKGEVLDIYFDTFVISRVY